MRFVVDNKCMFSFFFILLNYVLKYRIDLKMSNLFINLYQF